MKEVVLWNLTPITVVELVVVAIRKVFGILLLKHTLATQHHEVDEVETNLNFLVRHTIADTCIEFVERLPCELWVGQELGSLNRSLQCRRPDLQCTVRHIF